SSRRKASQPQPIAPCRLEKPDRYWSAPRAGESPLISGPEIGYLEKTGQVLVRTPGCEKPGDFSPGNRLSRKNGTVIVPHLRVAESPVISVPEIGYVRRSEVIPGFR